MGSRARTRRTMTLASAAVAFAVLGGCSLFVSLDGLSDGAGTGTGSDGAASDGASGSDGSSGTDSGPGKDAAPSDGGIDACTFCDDFDDRSDPQGSWSRIAGNVTLATDHVVSPPNAAHFHLDAIDAGSSVCSLAITLPLTNSTASIDFDFLLASDISSATGYGNLMSIGLTGKYAGSFSVVPSTWATDYWVNLPDAGHIQHSFGSSIPVDQTWHHVRYAIFFDDGKGTFDVTLDGVTLVSQINLVTFASVPSPSDIDVSVGFIGTAGLPPVDAYIDNVAVR